MTFISGPRNKKKKNCMENCTFVPPKKWPVQKKIDRRAHTNASNTATAYQNDPNTATSLEYKIVSGKVIHYEINERIMIRIMKTKRLCCILRYLGTSVGYVQESDCSFALF